MKLSSYWYRRVYQEDNEAESYLFIHLLHHFHQMLLKLFQYLMRQTVGKEVINRRSASEGVNDL